MKMKMMTSKFRITCGMICVFATAIWFADPVAAQQADSRKPHEQASVSAAEQGSQNTSGSDQNRSFGGPEGVSQTLKADEARVSIFPMPRWAKPYFDWKKRIKDDYGLSFGLSAYWLYQKASDSLSDNDDAFGGIYRFQGSWVAFARGTGHPGRLEWRIENRSSVGGWLSPSQLGSEIGAAALNTGFAYSDNFETDLSVLNWTQGFNDRRAGVAVGRLAFDVYLDAFMFQTFSRGFINRAFVLNPTLATTGIGALGAVAKGFVTDNLWLGGQIYDGNAVSGEFDFDTFQEHEWLGAVEIGFTPSISRYKTDRIQFTYWGKDARQKAGVPRGKGWVVSASYRLTERFIPFTRFGHSDGGAGVAAESAASIGFEFTPRNDQAWSFGAGWAKPSEKTSGPDLDDEYVFETSYKFQVWPFLSLMPDVQLLLNPAKNPAKSSVWVFGLRCILTL
jgi:porin